MNPTDQPFINPEIICRDDFDDTLVLFHPHLGQAIPVAGFARDLWHALDGTRPLTAIARDLATQYAQPPDTVLDDTLAFTQELYRRMFVLTEPLAPVPEHIERPPHYKLPDGDTTPPPAPVHNVAFGLTLADGTQFVLRALDEHAARVVQFFAQSARLEPQESLRPFRFEEILVATRPFDAPDKIVCEIQPPHILRRGMRRREDSGRIGFTYEPLPANQWLWLQLLQLTACLGNQIQSRGGVLLHSALALSPLPNELCSGEGQGVRGGVLLTAHSGVGKSTASRRLPAPWVSLCDDTTLIVRDDADAYWAHPMPTWSHIFYDEKIRTWDTQSAVPLRAIFLLRQGEQDRVTPLNPAHALGFLLERAQEPTQYWRENFSLRELGAFNRAQFDNLCELVRAMPCFLLDARLDGEFWKEMEKVIG